MGRGSPSMSVARLARVVPASTTPETAEVRWRSQAVGSENQVLDAVVSFVVSVALAPLRTTMGLFARLFRTSAEVVAAKLHSIELA